MTRRHPLAMVFVLIGILVAATAGAVPLGVVSRKLVVVDRLDTARGKAKTVYVAKDAAVTKGGGGDRDQISVQLHVTYDGGNAGGAFTIPAGRANGWVANKNRVARYVNKKAPGGPTQAKLAVIKPGKLLKLVGKGLGDMPLDIRVAGDPAGPVRTAYCVDNGGEENCHCSTFDACAYEVVAGGTGGKLVCKVGDPDPGCSAIAMAASAVDGNGDGHRQLGCFGDSNTVDGLATDPETDRLVLTSRWCDALLETLPGWDGHVVGWPGTTATRVAGTCNGLPCASEVHVAGGVALEPAMDVATLAWGSNDVMRGIEPAAIAAELAKQAETLRAAGVRALVATVPPQFGALGGNQDVIEALNAMIVADNAGCVVDFSTAFTRDLFGDDVHLNDEGHALRGARVRQALLVSDGC